MSIAILIADDHAIVREGLKRMLGNYPDFSVVAEASNGIEAVEAVQKLHPDVAVLDIGMPRMNGIEAAARIARTLPHTAVLILTVHYNAQYVAKAVSSGARGYILKDLLTEEEFVQALRLLSEGGRFFSPAVAGFVPLAEPSPPSAA